MSCLLQSIGVSSTCFSNACMRCACSFVHWWMHAFSWRCAAVQLAQQRQTAVGCVGCLLGNGIYQRRPVSIGFQSHAQDLQPPPCYSQQTSDTHFILLKHSYCLTASNFLSNIGSHPQCICGFPSNHTPQTIAVIPLQSISRVAAMLLLLLLFLPDDPTQCLWLWHLSKT